MNADDAELAALQELAADQEIAALQEPVAIRLIFSVVGVGAKGQVVDMPALRAAELVSAHAAVFLDPDYQPEQPESDTTADQAAEEKPGQAPDVSDTTAADQEGVTRGKGANTRESRPRSSASGRNAGGGTAGPVDNAGNTEPGQDHVAG
jgi:hypothetical protein